MCVDPYYSRYNILAMGMNACITLMSFEKAWTHFSLNYFPSSEISKQKRLITGMIDKKKLKKTLSSNYFTCQEVIEQLLIL